MTINTVRGVDVSAIIYSVTETVRVNGLNVYYYMKHLLTELTQVVRADGSIDEKDLEPLMPWSKDLPAECYKRRKQAALYLAKSERFDLYGVTFTKILE